MPTISLSGLKLKVFMSFSYFLRKFLLFMKAAARASSTWVIKSPGVGMPYSSHIGPLTIERNKKGEDKAFTWSFKCKLEWKGRWSASFSKRQDHRKRPLVTPQTGKSPFHSGKFNRLLSLFIWNSLLYAHAHHVFFFNFLKLIYFNWSLLYNIQYYGGFCHTLTWISHGCTCVPHPKSPSLLPSHLIPSLWVVPVHQLWVPCFMHRTWTGHLLHIW